MSLEKLVDWAMTPEEEISGWHCGYEAARKHVLRLLAEEPATLGLQETLPPGWKLNSVDFSVNAGDSHTNGKVMLKRDRQGMDDWLCMSPSTREGQTCYAIGYGATLEEAFASAVDSALNIGPLKFTEEAKRYLA